MSIDLVGRVGQVSVDASNAGSASPAQPTVRDAVATDLPPAETVQATSRSAALPVDDTQYAQARAASLQRTASLIRSEFVYDAAKQLVFVSVDEITGDVIEKFPNNAVLRDASYQQASAKGADDLHLVETVA